MDAIFKALADSTRRKILSLLKEREMTAGEIAEHFQISAPSMSHHFNILKQADLIAPRREGQQIFYSLNTTVFQDVVSIMMGLFGTEETKSLPESLTAGLQEPAEELPK